MQALLFSTLVGDAGRELSIPPIDQEQAIKVKIVSEIQYKKLFNAPLGVGTVGRNDRILPAASQQRRAMNWVRVLEKLLFLSD